MEVLIQDTFSILTLAKCFFVVEYEIAILKEIVGQNAQGEQSLKHLITVKNYFSYLFLVSLMKQKYIASTLRKSNIYLPGVDSRDWFYRLTLRLSYTACTGIKEKNIKSMRTEQM